MCINSEMSKMFLANDRQYTLRLLISLLSLIFHHLLTKSYPSVYHGFIKVAQNV